MTFTGYPRVKSVKCATTANITLIGTQTIDDILVSVNDRVLVKNQGSSAENGIYVVAVGAWSRAPEVDSWAEVPSMFCFVEQGTTNADTGWVSTADQGGTLGVTAISWTRFAGGVLPVASGGTGVTTSTGTGSVVLNTSPSLTTIASLSVGSETATITSNTLTPSTNKPMQRITTGAGPLNMVASPIGGQQYVLINETGVDIIISNTIGGTPANQIITGTGSNFTFKNQSAVGIIYDGGMSKWVLTGGAGGGGSSVDVFSQASTFSVGDILYLNGSIYTLANASAASTADVVGIVSKVIVPNTQHELTLLGIVSDITSASFTEASLPAVGSTVFLATTAGKMTVTEPSVLGQVSVPLGVYIGSNKMYMFPKRGAIVGGVNARTQLSWTSSGIKDFQSVASYDAGEISGWIYIAATSSLRFYVQAQFAKNGAATDYNVSYQTTGDTPPAGFSVGYNSSTSNLTINIPTITGFTGLVFNYALNAPAVGATLPLTIAGDRVLTGTPTVKGLNATDNTGLTLAGSINNTYTAINSALTLDNTHYYVSASGATTYTVTLPSAAGIQGRSYIIKSNMNTGVLLTVATTSSQTIDGSTTLTLSRYSALHVISNGSNWEVY